MMLGMNPRRLRSLVVRSDIGELAAHSLAFLLAMGGIVVGASCFAPGARAHPVLVGFVAAGALITSALLARFGARITRPGLHALGAITAVMITVTIAATQRAATPDSSMYLLAAMWTGFYLGNRAALAHVAWMTTLHGSLLAIDGGVLEPGVSARDVALLSIMAVIAGLLAGMSRRAVDTLNRSLERAASVDHLTGVLNRAALVAEADAMGAGTLMLFDIDGFRDTNDRHGAGAADAVLVEVGRRLVEGAPDGVVARVGGDEFAVLLPGQADVAVAVNRIDGVMAPPTIVDTEMLEVGLSCGTAISDGTVPFADLMANADLALEEARSALVQGATMRHVAYAPRLRERMEQRRDMVADIHEALVHNQFAVHFQPLVDLATGRVEGAEALVRWFHPQHGFVPPDRFIPVAEDSGQILEIGDFVMRASLAEAARWQEVADTPPFVSVNLSARQLMDAGLVDRVDRLVGASGLDASRVMLEITETSVMADAGLARYRLGELRRRGFLIALDDFGTGHSSLAYLRDLPATELKLAREFVSDISTSHAGHGMVDSIVGLAHLLDLRVVAEGIETREDHDALRDLGIDLGQGYLMLRPMPADDLVALLAAGAGGDALRGVA